MAQLRYNTTNKIIEATIRKDFMDLPDNGHLGKNSEMEDEVGNRAVFIHDWGRRYNGRDIGWCWDISWLEDVVILNEQEEEEE